MQESANVDGGARAVRGNGPGERRAEESAAARAHGATALDNDFQLAATAAEHRMIVPRAAPATDADKDNSNGCDEDKFESECSTMGHGKPEQDA